MPATLDRLYLPAAITLVVIALAFLTYQVTRHTQHRRTREDFDRTRKEVQELTLKMLHAEHGAVEELARKQTGLANRDAAALLMALRLEIERAEKENVPPSREALDGIKKNLELIRDGRPAEFPRGECFLRAYYAPVDGSFQPYGINVPKSYDGSRPVPLILFLHGLSGFRLYQCMSAPAYAGAITVSPQGRGATDYMYVGEDDIQAVLDEVTRLYNIDPSRIVLTGRSMGGTGSFHIAVHYPDRFMGIVPFAGNADHRAWEGRWGWNFSSGSSGGSPAPHRKLRAFLHRSKSPVFYAENLEHTSAVVVHGTGDEVVPVEHARGMVGRLRQLSHPAIEYLEFPQAGHGDFPAWTLEYGMAKVFARGPAKAPDHIRYRLTSLRHNRAWWLRVDLLDDPVAFSEIRAQIKGDALEIGTDNIAALTLHLNAMPTRPADVLIDGKWFAAPADKPLLKLERGDGIWRPAEPHGLMKHRGLSGPVSDLMRDPFVLVYGTQGDDELRKRIARAEAERAADEWAMRYGTPPRLKPDAQIDETDVRALNLILFGGPSVNAVTARIADKLPLRLEGDGVAVGGRTLMGDDIGFVLCYPNPLNPMRLVAVVAGRTPGALYQAFDRFGAWFNWGIYDKHRWFDYAVFDARSDGPESLLTVGFFDNLWQLPSEQPGALGGGGAWERDEEFTAALAPQGTPRYVSVSDAGDTLALSDLFPAAIEQYRGAVGFDRTYAGRPIKIDGKQVAKGLGVKAPSTLIYKLDGSFTHFEATVALTPGHKTVLSPARVAAEGVIFQVRDGEKVLAETEPISHRPDGTASAVLSADIDGVTDLQLVAKPEHGRTWLYGAAVWAEPTLKR